MRRVFQHRHGRALLLAGALLAAPQAVWAQENPHPADAVQNEVRQAVADEAAVQREMDHWANQRDELLEDIRMATLELQWLELQEKKLTRYVAANDEKLGQLEDRHGRYAIIALDLENQLLDDVARLRAFVEHDAPFLPEERQARLHFLQESLDDPALGIGEKYRRFMEGLTAEVEYGRKLETSVQIARLDGTDLELITLKAGRAGVYCLTFDRSRGGIWDSERQEFTPLDPEGLRAVQALEETALSRQYYQSLAMPVARIDR